MKLFKRTRPLEVEMYEIIETFLSSKTLQQTDCEDAIVCSARYVAVIDGATDKTGAIYEGVKGGRFAAAALSAAIEDIPEDANAEQAIRCLTEALSDALAPYPPLLDAPSASLVVYSARRHEIWRVGDCSFRTNDGANIGSKAIDVFAAGVRSAFLQAQLAAGHSERDLLADDPGRAVILPLLRSQHHLRNPSREFDLSYGAIDGQPVPERFIETFPLAELERQEIVLASDGYPVLEGTLAASEERLREVLADDPLLIREFKETKGVRPGQVSYDDRAYVRIAV